MKTMYYIAVLPPENLIHEIRTFKEVIAENYQSRHALRSPAHITLQMPFHFEENEEKRLITALNKTASSMLPFDCSLKNFGHFDQRVIYIDVTPSPELTHLRTTLQQVLKEQFGFSDSKLPKRFHPHITIANRDLTPHKFTLCWEKYAEKTYDRTFRIKALTLMKHAGDHWKIHHRSSFDQL